MVLLSSSCIVCRMASMAASIRSSFSKISAMSTPIAVPELTQMASAILRYVSSAFVFVAKFVLGAVAFSSISRSAARSDFQEE
ncbi:hypothetical protein K458DRAFT_162170 [Lentithecium fluviatile CBS 122367]|uniref:Uncharacterized protein n=1 Tax=Lentithecium fluviatile CBS 122367 TaxID=1168545 RepID=A0A6G1IG44_9PLEO|nr:hypothetical protein K458DRAFT_162170 [Lentithecium fluviatile CBS 122367]